MVTQIKKGKKFCSFRLLLGRKVLRKSPKCLFERPTICRFEIRLASFLTATLPIMTSSAAGDGSPHEALPTSAQKGFQIIAQPSSGISRPATAANQGTVSIQNQSSDHIRIPLINPGAYTALSTSTVSRAERGIPHSSLLGPYGLGNPLYPQYQPSLPVQLSPFNQLQNHLQTQRHAAQPGQFQGIDLESVPDNAVWNARIDEFLQSSRLLQSPSYLTPSIPRSNVTWRNTAANMADRRADTQRSGMSDTRMQGRIEPLIQS